MIFDTVSLGIQPLLYSLPVNHGFHRLFHLFMPPLPYGAFGMRMGSGH